MSNLFYSTSSEPPWHSGAGLDRSSLVAGWLVRGCGLTTGRVVLYILVGCPWRRNAGLREGAWTYFVKLC